MKQFSSFSLCNEYSKAYNCVASINRLFVTSYNYIDCNDSFQNTIHYTSNIDYKENVIHRIQFTASHHAITQLNSVNIIKSDAEHKRVRI
ncbi:hypothetical protein T11_4910 [Trichinella zimbabwensis]|uniref:Uncharacterized protein n=1 Tax=Trichinella zimbabwensis TaxID=268475 RepID=A0A0V1HWQ0_9BILA|nr:hypothetical protein T11_4910 [Trichinella zimbabwensis]